MHHNLRDAAKTIVQLHKEFLLRFTLLGPKSLEVQRHKAEVEHWTREAKNAQKKATSLTKSATYYSASSSSVRPLEAKEADQLAKNDINTATQKLAEYSLETTRLRKALETTSSLAPGLAVSFMVLNL